MLQAEYTLQGMALWHRMNCLVLALGTFLSLAPAMCMEPGAQDHRTSPAISNDGAFQVLLKQGFALHQQARFVAAIAVLERARRLEPQDSDRLSPLRSNAATSSATSARLRR
jgi:hypothetical protein